MVSVILQKVSSQCSPVLPELEKQKTINQKKKHISEQGEEKPGNGLWWQELGEITWN